MRTVTVYLRGPRTDFATKGDGSNSAANDGSTVHRTRLTSTASASTLMDLKNYASVGCALKHKAGGCQVSNNFL